MHATLGAPAALTAARAARSPPGRPAPRTVSEVSWIGLLHRQSATGSPSITGRPYTKTALRPPAATSRTASAAGQQQPLPSSSSPPDTGAARAAAERAADQVDQVMAEVGREVFVARAIGQLLREFWGDGKKRAEGRS
jgi:hypothetical protein